MPKRGGIWTYYAQEGRHLDLLCPRGEASGPNMSKRGGIWTYYVQEGRHLDLLCPRGEASGPTMPKTLGLVKSPLISNQGNQALILNSSIIGCIIMSMSMG